ncbi:tetratricopeptide repeat protein [Novosphingobium sp. FSY-8]|uniref:Tetratricopeptide repeat protein n=1 Tax=Novosphingobium ovatum TaxID=1908523 RepID=A0ABW9X8T8_9SPHN|nr:tetratricopeptide repeat protein [Novosphingobium ovatum]NBC34949.1 tetratricopeptide repeat protein [Novosphingobium ovatum]
MMVEMDIANQMGERVYHRDAPQAGGWRASRLWRGVAVTVALGAVAAVGLMRHVTQDPATLEAPTRLAQAPLSWAPFYHAALASGDRARALALLEEARRRDPHVLGVRLALIERYVQADRPDAALAELVVLGRMQPAVAGELMARLAMSVRSGDVADEIMVELSRQPALLPAFLGTMARGSAPVAVIARVAQWVPAGALRDPQIRAQTAALWMRAGAFTRARAMAMAGSKGAEQPVFSPDFADMRAHGPFGWQVETGPVGAVDPDPAGGLALVAYGRGDGALIGQWLALTPGRWRVTLRHERQGRAEGALALQVDCADGGTLAQMPLRGGEGLVDASVDLTVPTGRCTGQRLSIIGRAVDGGGSQATRILRLSAAPVMAPVVPDTGLEGGQ